MCDHHTGKVVQALGDLLGLYDDCGAAMLPGQRTGGTEERVSTSSSAPLPINADARAAQEDMRRLLAEAEVDYSRARGWGFHPYPIGERAVVAHLARYARRHLEGMLTRDAAFGVEVLKLKHRVRAMLGLTRLVQRLGAPCPDCGAPLLFREDGSSMVECRACGSAFHEDRLTVDEAS